MEARMERSENKMRKNAGPWIQWPAPVCCLALCATADAAVYGGQGSLGPGVATWLLINAIAIGIATVIWTGWAWLAARFFGVQPGLKECLIAAVGMSLLSIAYELCKFMGIGFPLAAIGLLIASSYWLREALKLKSAFEGFLMVILPAVIVVVIYGLLIGIG